MMAKKSFKENVGKRFEIMHKLEEQSKPLLEIGLEPSFYFANIQEEEVSTITIYKHERYSEGPVYFVKHQVENDDYAEKWTLFKHTSVVIFGKKILENRVEVGQYKVWEDVVDDIVTLFKEGKL